MTRGLGGPRVKNDRRVREAEGGFCAPSLTYECAEQPASSARLKIIVRAWLRKYPAALAVARSPLRSALAKPLKRRKK
jgi:hypothetical protein